MSCCIVAKTVSESLMPNLKVYCSEGADLDLRVSRPPVPARFKIIEPNLPFARLIQGHLCRFGVVEGRVMSQAAAIVADQQAAVDTIYAGFWRRLFALFIDW